MTKEQIQDRITTLEADKNKFVEQAKAQLSAFDGAIQDCKYWLEQIEPETKPE